MGRGSYKNLVRRAVQVGVVVLGLLLLAASVLTTVGAERYVTGTVLPQMGKRLGATIAAADVGAVPGRVVLRDVAITPRGAATPLLLVHDVRVNYSLGSLLSGRRLDEVRLQGVDLQVDPSRGLPALRDFIAGLRRSDAARGRRHDVTTPRPRISLRELRVAYDDPAGLHARTRVDAVLETRRGRALLRGLKVWGTAEPVFRARAATVDVSLGAGQAITSASLDDPTLVVLADDDASQFLAIVERAKAALEVLRGDVRTVTTATADAGAPVRVEVHRGRAELIREGATLALRDMHGWVAPDLSHDQVAGRLVGRLGDASWEVEAECDLASRNALGRARVSQLPLQTVLPFLPRVPFDWTAPTLLSGHGDFRYDDAPGRLGLEGDLRAEGLTVTAPAIAAQPLRDLDVAVSGKGALWLRSREVAVSDARVAINGIPVLVHGDIARSGGLPRITADLTLPPTPCGSLLRAMPTALVAHLGGLQLEGVFGADLHVVLDLERPDNTDVRFDVGNDCRLLAEDFARVDRLRAPFVQRAVSAGQAVEFVTGPGSPGWTSYDQLPANLVGAVLTTEDGGFFSHSGFSAESIRRALVRDLREGRFVVGGSTISMQLAKNVFLGQEKTIARKIQEAALTWMLEQSMAKEEILELYFNVIEYGPGLYGIRNASRHFFGVAPRDLTAVQAVYIATLLPSPVRRYSTFLRGAPTPALMERLHRILRLMSARGRLEGSLEEALAEPLTFRGGSQYASGEPLSDDDAVVQ